MQENCRICLEELYKANSIDMLNNLNNNVNVLRAIIEVSSVEVPGRDTLPQSICKPCFIKLEQCYTFRNLIIISDRKLKELLEKCEDKNHKMFAVNEYTLSNDTVSVMSENSENDPLNNFNVESDYSATKLFNCQTYNKIQNDVDGDIIKPSKEKLYKCQECKISFKKSNHLNVHMIYKHLEKQFSCDICGKKFARKYDLNYHIRVHTGERPFTCEMCGKTFRSSSYFCTHKRIHFGDKKVKCKFCQSAFINSDQLKIHIRQKHTGEKPFLCELCSNTFSSSSALCRHKRDVHDKKVECPFCTKLYNNRVLKDHIKRHKEKLDGVKRYSCDVCERQFTSGASRKRHMVIHSGEKAFKCDVCEKAFNQKSTLQTHMKIHIQTTPYQCELCPKTFKYKHHLKKHFGKYHKNNENTNHYTEDIKNKINR